MRRLSRYLRLREMHLSVFDYELPDELIAQQPLEQREASRMLVVDRASRTWKDSRFELLFEYLNAGDLIVLNNTQVFPARLVGQREPTGGSVEVLLIREIEPLRWEVLVRPARRLRRGARLRFGSSSLRAEVVECFEKGLRQLKFECDLPLETLLDELGQMPLPPYIKRPFGTSIADRERYQTVFARKKGAIAAPTAGLHFTKQIIEGLMARQIKFVEITLHVGYGTFEPVRVDHVEHHKVAPELFDIDDEAAHAINSGRAEGRRIVAVGTTTSRAVESAVNADGKIEPGQRPTALTITPGFEFRVVDALLTNFHLPRSSLLLLVSAFAGCDLTLAAYRYAVAKRFRFYSYGDCMFVI
ncbi:MAG: tRNA preQ1(34) S-adenosylmethionine ribosyltransferase-isomerase QueA [Pyrinomonadaceae bacterium]